MSAYGEFLRGLIAAPKAVSAPTPSSPVLSAAIAAKLDLSRPGLVVELGAGTGVVTQALLARGISPARLLVLENCPYYAALLRKRFSGVEIVESDALQFDRLIPAGMQVAAVVSGIPLLHLPPARRRAFIERALALQPDGGLYVQLSYGWVPPIQPGRDVQMSRTLVWRNFPPAHIWTFTARAAAPVTPRLHAPLASRFRPGGGLNPAS
jgi:phosphatidylethanolamine/phosphatidyl-N-methylethanolamine N-methyltransferase